MYSQNPFVGLPCLIDGVIWVTALEFGDLKEVKNTNKCIISYSVNSVCNKHSLLSTTEIKKKLCYGKDTLYNLDVTNIYKVVCVSVYSFINCSILSLSLSE